ncbi:MAG: hypothetical protein ACTMKU_04090 [Actinomycetaceae bacterium]
MSDTSGVPVVSSLEERMTLDTVPDADPMWAEQVTVTMEDLGLTEEDAVVHVDQTMDRMFFRDDLYETHADCIGGFSHDATTGVMSVFTTTEACDTHVEAAAVDVPFEVMTERVEHSGSELEEFADALNASPPAEVPSFTGAYIDFESNSVLVYVSSAADVQTTAAEPTIDDAVSSNTVIATGNPCPTCTVIVQEDPNADAVPEVCTTTEACGQPLRSGIEIRTTNTSGDETRASAGYTMTAADGSRWLLTALHIGGGGSTNMRNHMVWHGEQNIGRVRESFLSTTGSPQFDFTRVRIENSYWLQGSRGWLSSPTQFRQSRDSIYAGRITLNDGMIPLDWYTTGSVGLQRGDAVCLFARASRAGDMCGTISQGSPDGFFRVDDYDACGGDSGGAWTHQWGAANGEYVAVGVHRGGRNGCPALSNGNNSTRGYSIFTPISYIHKHYEQTAGQSLLIDTR